MRTRPGQGGSGSALPALPATYLERPGLHQALDAGLATRPALVTAGPGWGKSTVVAAWAGGRDACWVSLDRADSSVPRLANRILRAIRRLRPDLPAELVIASMPAGGGRDQVRVDAVVGALCTLLAALPDDEVTLVLDGLHELPADGGAIRLVAGLCEQAPPALHLVVITEPLAGGFAGWPGLPRAAAIGPDLLAFTEAEVAAFLEAALSSAQPAPLSSAQPAPLSSAQPAPLSSAQPAPLSSAQPAPLSGTQPAAAEVHKLTSGWPAAVRLAAQALRVAGPDGRNGRSGIDGRGAAIRPRPAGGTVLEELAAQVLAAEPEPNRRLLATVAALGAVDAPMCAALGHPRATAALPRLARHGLLRPDSQDNRSWSLVGPVRDLLGRGDPQDAPRVRGIRIRAAAYRAGRGEYGAALGYLVAAGDRPGAGRLLVEHGEAMLAEGEAGAVLAAADALKLGGSDPHLLAVLGYARQLTGDWFGALALVRAAAGSGPLEPVLASRLGQLYFVTGRPEEAVAAFERTRIGDGASGDEVWLLCHAVIWLRAVGADDRARATAGLAAAAAERSADPVSMARSHWALALMAAHDGDRAAHDMHHRRALRLAGQTGDRVQQLGLRINHASYLAEEGAPAEAIEEAESALRLGQALGVIGYEPLCYSIRARARARLGQFEQALADVDASQQQWQDIGPSMDVAFGLIVRGDIHRRRGEPGQAQAALAEALRSADAAGMRPLQALALAKLARTRAADDLDSARDLADRAVALATGTGRVPALLASGWVALLAGDRDAASKDAVQARSVAGARRDLGGLAEALELAVLAAPDPKAALSLLDEAAALWADLADLVGQARVRLIAARLAGPAGWPAADAATRALQRYGLRMDSGIADALAVPVPQPPITVRTLGAFQVLHEGTPIPRKEWRSKKARDLFKILITQRGRPVSRERLVHLLWPDDGSPARTANRLSVLLSTLRGVLDPGRAMPEPGPVVADRDTVALDLAQFAVDIEAFLGLAATAQAADRHGDPAATDLLATADAAYTGDFLPEDRYHEWAEPLRDTTRTTHIAVLRALLRHTTDPDRRERHLLQLLDHDRYDEQTHRQLVHLLHTTGRHGEAHRRYAAYAARMAEIGVTPAPPEHPAS
jgi:ATP/maltotriose-dependent transcriptional regulator MalT/DNA-binding SARP family transcriptional activator